MSEAVIYDEEYGNDSFWYSTSAISAEGASQLSQDSAELIFQKHAHVPINLTPILPAGSVPAPESPSTPAPAPDPAPDPASTPTPAVAGEYDDIVGTYIDENQGGLYMFIGYEDSSKATACIALALAIDDFSVKIENREGNNISAIDFDASVSSEPRYAVDLDCSQPGKILAGIYISEYDYYEDITFVPYPDTSYPNPYYIG